MKQVPQFSRCALAIACTTALMTLSTGVQAEEKQTIVIKIDGKDRSVPEATGIAVDKAMSALHEALAKR